MSAAAIGHHEDLARPDLPWLPKVTSSFAPSPSCTAAARPTVDPLKATHQAGHDEMSRHHIRFTVIKPRVMTLRHVLHQISNANFMRRQGAVLLRCQTIRREAGLVEKLPELVPATRVVVTSLCSVAHRRTSRLTDSCSHEPRAR